MKRAGDVFSALFDEGMLRKADGYSALVSCWKDLMEKNGIAAAAAYSRIRSLERGLVWIEVDHPACKQILQTKQSKLLYDFRYRFPELDISGISIVLSRPGSPPNGRPENSAPPAERAAASVASGGEPSLVSTEKVPFRSQGIVGYELIKDPALREVLMRLEQRIAKRENEG